MLTIFQRLVGHFSSKYSPKLWISFFVHNAKFRDFVHFSSKTNLSCPYQLVLLLLWLFKRSNIVCCKLKTSTMFLRFLPINITFTSRAKRFPGAQACLFSLQLGTSLQCEITHMGLVHHTVIVVCLVMPQILLVLIASTHEGWPGWVDLDFYIIVSSYHILHHILFTWYCCYIGNK